MNDTHSVTIALKAIQENSATQEQYALLWSRYYGELLRRVWQQLNDDDSRNDVATDAFYAVIKSLEKGKLEFNNRKPFRSFLLQRLKWKLGEKWKPRKRRIQSTQPSNSASAILSQACPHELACIADFARALCARLSTDQREVFRRMLYGFKAKEIAEDLATTTTWVQLMITGIRETCNHLRNIEGQILMAHPPNQLQQDAIDGVNQLIRDVLSYADGRSEI